MGVVNVVLFLSFVSCISPQAWNTYDYMKREHSLVKPYQGVGTSIPYWDFLGSTMVTSNYVRLTGDIQSQRGAIWNKVPLSVRNWEMQIHFKVHGRGKDLFGDGFAFWYVKEPMQTGDVFGSRDFFTGLAIIADTYSNHNGVHNHGHPYISAMVNNGTLHYDHDRDGTHTQLSGCVAKFRNLDHDTFLSIKYVHDTLTVSVDIDNKMAYKDCFTVNGVFLPTGYYFGVSAATGDLSDAHDIVSLKLYDLTTPDDDILEDRANIMPSALYMEPPRDHVDDPKPSSLSVWKQLVLLVFGVCAICGAVFIGGLFYVKHKEQQRKRFY
ncbi:vesicular integral-membrane protein VIP36 isoform X1 [Macrobrachium rosenbergii]|uniref:L-type lectin n=3 Tax=Macrobrachium rosenbergii TaxID=79674 RepID=A0A0D6DQI0_MACRS|nr:L-type lectin [Macrobrachium rosenbergii]CCV20011.1 mannose-binding lectin [Macrobrachium rosenbergii]